MATNPYDDIVRGAGSSPGGNPYDDIVRSSPETPEEPDDSWLSAVGRGLGSGLETVGQIANIPMSGVDWLARAGARAQGLPVADDATAAQMVRAGVGLSQGDESYVGKLGGRAIEFGADVLLDPTTYLGLGFGTRAIKGARAAEGALSKAGRDIAPEALQALEGAVKAGRLPAAIQRGASGLLAGSMGLGAFREGEQAYQTLQEQGWSPEAAEQILGAALGAGMAGALTTHAASSPFGDAAGRMRHTEATDTLPAPPEAPTVAPEGVATDSIVLPDPAPVTIPPEAPPDMWWAGDPRPGYGLPPPGMPEGRVPPPAPPVQLDPALFAPPAPDPWGVAPLAIPEPGPVALPSVQAPAEWWGVDPAQGYQVPPEFMTAPPGPLSPPIGPPPMPPRVEGDTAAAEVGAGPTPQELRQRTTALGRGDTRAASATVQQAPPVLTPPEAVGAVTVPAVEQAPPPSFGEPIPQPPPVAAPVVPPAPAPPVRPPLSMGELPTDRVPGPQRREASDFASKLAKRFAANDYRVDDAELANLPEHLKPHAEAIRSEAALEASALHQGRTYLETIADRHKQGAPGVTRVSTSDPGTYDVTQRTADGRLVGAYSVHNDTLQMVAGGKPMDSPLSARPLYEQMVKDGVARNDVLTILGIKARRRNAERATLPVGERNDAGVRGEAPGVGAEPRPRPDDSGRPGEPGQGVVAPPGPREGGPRDAGPVPGDVPLRVGAAPPTQRPSVKAVREQIHATAKAVGINADAPAFRKWSKEITGKEHLDNMNRGELEKVHASLKADPKAFGRVTKEGASRGGPLPKPEKDSLGYPILKGQEHWTPQERQDIHEYAKYIAREVAARERAEPTGPRPRLDAQGNQTGEWYGVDSKKTGTPLEGLPYPPDKMVQALETDRGNKIELEVHHAVESEARALREENDAVDTGGDASFNPEDFEGVKYSSRPAPGQRGLAGIAEDVPTREQREQPKGPKQAAMFGGEMLQGTERKGTEAREAGGSLFTQERDARERREAGAQRTLGEESPDGVQIEEGRFQLTRGKVRAVRGDQASNWHANEAEARAELESFEAAKGRVAEHKVSREAAIERAKAGEATSADVNLLAQGRRNLTREQAQAVLRHLDIRGKEGETLVRRMGGRIVSSGDTVIDSELVFKRAAEHLAKREAEKPQPDIKYATAYHGSKHDFDEFTTQRMGSGEGSQAYGWGMYFAGNKDVAEFYRKSTSKRSWKYGPMEMTKDSEHRSVAEALDRVEPKNNSPEAIREAIQKEIAGLRDHAKFARDVYGADTAQQYTRKAELLEKLDPAELSVRHGRLYTVDLAPKEHEYLEYEKPLSEQSEGVKKALDSLGIGLNTSKLSDKQLMARARRYFNSDRAQREWREDIGMRDQIRRGYKAFGEGPEVFRDWVKRQHAGSSIMEGMLGPGGMSEIEGTGSTVYSKLARKLGSEEAASRALFKAGVPGIKFLDQMSRGPGTTYEARWSADGTKVDVFDKKGGDAVRHFDSFREADKWIEDNTKKTHNYVIFDDSLVKTTEKYAAAKQNERGFFSQLSRAMDETKQVAGKAEDWNRYLRDQKRGVKAEELKWTGLDDYLKERAGQKVTKAEIQEFLKQNEVQVEEVTKGDVDAPLQKAVEYHHDGLIGFLLGKRDFDGRGANDYALDAARGDLSEGQLAHLARDPEQKKLVDNLREAYEARKESGASELEGRPKFSQYQLPGGENYRELLLKTPKRTSGAKIVETDGGNFEIHFPDGEVAKGITGNKAIWSDRAAAERALPVYQDQGAGDFKGGHYDELNILAHVRFNERRDADGARVLFLEEIQSDWAQKGRREGFVGPERRATKAEQKTGYWEVTDADGRFVTNVYNTSAETASAAIAEANRRIAENPQSTGVAHAVPAGPFVGKTEAWSELAMKRMIRYAAENGFDKVAWTTGEQQAARYDLSKQIREIEWARNHKAKPGSATEGTYSLDIVDLDGGRVHLPGVEMGRMTPKQIEETVGKDIADKIVAAEEHEGTLEGLDLKVGGEGMAGFYDKILPGVAGKLGKKFGASVGETKIEGGQPETGRGGEFEAWARTKGVTEEVAFDDWQSDGPLTKQWRATEAATTVHSLPITDAMRDSVMQGQPLFRATKDATLPGITRETIKAAFAAGGVRDAGKGAWDVSLPGGRVVKVRVKPDGIEYNAEAFKAGYSREKSSAEQIVGAWKPVDRGGIMWLAKEADQATVHHEAFHGAMDMALSPSEKAAVLKKYGSEEAAAEAYATWNPAKATNSWFSKILSFFKRTYRALRPSWESAFERTRSGEAYGKDAGPAEPTTRFATAPKAPPQIKTDVTGRPMRPDEAPRVEAKVENLRTAEKAGGEAPSELSRETRRDWKSLDPEVQKVLRDVSTDEMARQRLLNRAGKGHINDAETMALESLSSGARERFEASREALEKAKADGTGQGEANVKALQSALELAAYDSAKVARADVEAGTKIARALAARARVMEAGQSVPDAFLRKVFREIEGVTDQQAGDLLRILQTDPVNLPDALQRAMQPKRLAKWLELWKAGLVSGPGTQVANILGNVGEQAVRVGETATAALVDRVLGGSRQRSRGEVGAEVRGGLSRLTPALGDLGKSLTDALKLAPEEIDLKKSLEHQVGKIGGKTGRAVRVPFRILQSFDDFFKATGGGAELGKLAYRRARAEMPNGTAAEAQARAAKIQKEALDPDHSGHEDILRAVAESRQSRTFQNAPGPLMTSLMRMRSQNPLLHVVFPFLQTPANIAKLTIERSPVGFVKATKAYKAWKAADVPGADAATVARLRGEAVDAIARPLLGTTLLMGFAAYAKSGGMTGSGPVDPKDQQALKETGWQPYSFKVGKSYVPFNRFEPVSSILGVAADLAEISDQKKAGDMFEKGLGSIASNLTSKTYLQGLADAASMISKPKEFASRYVSNLAGSVVPNIVGKLGQAIDPTVRDTTPSSTGLLGIPERAAKSIAAKIPGAAQFLPERRTATGERAERPTGLGGAVSRFLLPSQITSEKPDKALERLLVEIDAVPGQPSRDFKAPGTGKKLRLTDAEYRILQEGNKAAATYIRERYLNNTAFQRLDPEDQKRRVEAVFTKARNAARDRLRSRLEFRRRLREASV